METVSDFIFWGSKITADGDCSHEIKRCLLLGRKIMTKLDSILKSRDVTLPTKIRLIVAMVFPVVMYGCESWTVKKVEHRRTDAFGLWCWRRLLRVLWTARRSNQCILKDINSGVSLEGLMLKMKLQYFGKLMWKFDSLEKTLLLGRIELNWTELNCSLQSWEKIIATGKLTKKLFSKIWKLLMYLNTQLQILLRKTKEDTQITKRQRKAAQHHLS